MSESLFNWNSHLQVASLSDVGMRRANNQDNFTVSLANSTDQYQRKGHLFIVADGMGAHAAGELASKLAIDHIPHLYNQFNDSSAPEEIKKAVAEANVEIHRRGQANEEFRNMGTTCSVLTLLPQGAVVAHVGDSRVYRMSQNRLEQLTFDHSLVWEMKAAGQLTAEEEAAGKIPKNVITRSLGPYPEIKVDLEGPFPIRVGDTFLLCSDGLTGVLSDAEIGAILANMTPDEAVRVLVDLGNLRGGPDNITVVVVQVIHQDMATHKSVAPLTINSMKQDRAVSPFWWAIAGGAILLALLFWFFSGSWVTAMIPGLIAVVALAWIGIQSIQAMSTGQVVGAGKRFGKGPYTRTSCTQGPRFSKQLAEILEQIKEGAQEQNWKIDWEQLNQLTEEAKGAAQKKDYARSIRFYSRAVSFLMDQLRNQQSGSSSSIEL